MATADPNPLLCTACQYAIQYADTLVQNNQTETQIVKGNEELAFLVRPQLYIFVEILRELYGWRSYIHTQKNLGLGIEFGYTHTQYSNPKLNLIPKKSVNWVLGMGIGMIPIPNTQKNLGMSMGSDFYAGVCWT